MSPVVTGFLPVVFETFAASPWWNVAATAGTVMAAVLAWLAVRQSAGTGRMPLTV